MSKAGRKPGPRKVTKTPQCKHFDWKDGVLVRCEKRSAPFQLYCSRDHAPYGRYAIDEVYLPKKAAS